MPERRTPGIAGILWSIALVIAVPIAGCVVLIYVVAYVQDGKRSDDAARASRDREARYGILADVRLWAAAEPGEREAVARSLNAAWLPEQLQTTLTFVRVGRSSCADLAFELAVFLHVPTGLEFVLLPGGRIPADGVDWRERSAVVVTPFLVSRTECTVDAYRRAGGKPPNDHASGTVPVTGLRWIQGLQFSHDLGMDLPNRYEWEYAARGGSNGTWYHGDDESKLHRYAWYGAGRDDEGAPRIPTDVGQKLPNAFGLFDTLGNAHEYCLDGWGVEMPTGDVTGDDWMPFRGKAGGSRNTDARRTVLSDLYGQREGDGASDVGFRPIIRLSRGTTGTRR